MSGPEPELVDRFRRDLERLLERSIGREEMFALAVSGGSDSLAMLLLAQAACPGRIIAATVDHGLRAEAVGETAHVAGLCRDLDVPHQTLRPDIAFDSFENLQERARNVRYRLLGRWATQGEATALLTAHHADDQAETFLMRAARGAGIGGLSAIRAVSFNLPKFYWPEDFAALGDTRPIIARPLLGWRKADLLGIVKDAGFPFVSDPANDDPRHDRTRFRRLLDQNGWLSADGIAKTATHLAEGEEALQQLASTFFIERLRFGEEDEVRIDVSSLPREVRRRMTWMAINSVRISVGIMPDWRGGEDVDGLLRALECGQTGTLAGVMATGGAVWWFRKAPPRRADVPHQADIPDCTAARTGSPSTGSRLSMGARTSRDRRFGRMATVEDTSMKRTRHFYIGGEWVEPAVDGRLHALVDPATEQVFAEIAMGGEADVDAAVAAAREAFESYARTTVADRTQLLKKILDLYVARIEEFAQAISLEIGAPMSLARGMQAQVVAMTIGEMLRVMGDYPFVSQERGMTIVKEPVGVCGLITPWNWPLHQIALKVVPALAAGCTMVLKPSENSATSALLFAEVLHDAGVPAGVFNLVNGDGPTVGHALSVHPGIDMMSFTGSTRAGIQLAKDAADTVKRVSQELGGKSANILLPDVDFATAVAAGVATCFHNSGQSCNAPTRMLVPRDRHDEALGHARAAAEATVVGPPDDERTTIGPVASRAQFDRVQGYIQRGIDEGATLVTGGAGRPDGLDHGFYVRPTVFGDVRNEMAIAREEIFGPVLTILPYDDEEDAIRIANDTPYGLAAYVQSNDGEAALRVASRLRAGNVLLNYASPVAGMPFGGFKQSGNGREWSRWGLEEFLEVKAIVGKSVGAGAA